jgi:hypothetical protein
MFSDVKGKGERSMAMMVAKVQNGLVFTVPYNILRNGCDQ